MSKKTIIAPSILSADFAHLADEIKAVEKAGADWIHVDVMDGHFVPNLTIGPVVVAALKKLNPPPLDVHLMITNPEKYVEAFADAGADYISVHQETCDLKKVITQIKLEGVKACAVINPATPVSTLETFLSDVDMILLMSVNPGFGGQSFIPSVLNKCHELSEIRKKKKLNFLIEVDGGINKDNAKSLKDAGADVLVAGNFIFKAKNYKQAIDSLKSA